MDDSEVSALQQLADERLDGRLRQRVEQLRRAGEGWREISELISRETKLGVAKSTLHLWASKGGWDVDPTPAGSRRAAS